MLKYVLYRLKDVNYVIMMWRVLSNEQKLKFEADSEITTLSLFKCLGQVFFYIVRVANFIKTVI